MEVPYRKHLYIIRGNKPKFGAFNVQSVDMKHNDLEFHKKTGHREQTDPGRNLKYYNLYQTLNSRKIKNPVHILHNLQFKTIEANDRNSLGRNRNPRSIIHHNRRRELQIEPDRFTYRKVRNNSPA